LSGESTNRFSGFLGRTCEKLLKQLGKSDDTATPQLKEGVNKTT